MQAAVSEDPRTIEPRRVAVWVIWTQQGASAERRPKHSPRGPGWLSPRLWEGCTRRHGAYKMRRS